METYSFRDWYNESMWDWAKRAGHAAMNWSPANPQTMGTYPSKYVDAQGKEIPDAPDSAMQPPMAQPMQSKRAARALPGGYGPTTQPQKKTVGFRISDMDNMKAAITDYLGLVSRFMTTVHKQVPYPDFIRKAVNSFEKNVGPAYKDLYSKVKWINDMNTLARSQNEWASEELFAEAVKVSYRRFEEMVAALRNLASTMKNWVYNMASKLPPAQGQRVKAIYDQNILRQQAFVGKQVMWLQQKLQQLMQANEIPYKDNW